MKLRFLMFIFAFILVTAQSFAVMACRPLILSDAKAQELIDQAYFIGLVRGYKYIEKYPDGALKEAALVPFAVYAAGEGVDFQKEIIVQHEDIITSCDAYVPQQFEIAEVMVVRQADKLMLRRLDFATLEFVDKLRQKMRYVGKEQIVGKE